MDQAQQNMGLGIRGSVMPLADLELSGGNVMPLPDPELNSWVPEISDGNWMPLSDPELSDGNWMPLPDLTLNSENWVTEPEGVVVGPLFSKAASLPGRQEIII